MNFEGLDELVKPLIVECLSKVTESLLEIFDGARFVRVEGALVFIWFGGPTIQIYEKDDNGVRGVDAFTLYPCDEKEGSRHPTYLEVHDSVLKHIAELNKITLKNAKDVAKLSKEDRDKFMKASSEASECQMKLRMPAKP